MNTSSEALAPALRCLNRQQRFLLFGAIYVTLWISTWYSARLLDNLDVVSLWFLPAGLRFVCLLVLGWRGLLLELAVQLAFLLMQLTQLAGVPIPEILSVHALWRIYNLLASLLANAALILPLRWWMRDSWDFSRPAHSALFLVASLGVSALSALAGTFGLLKLGFVSATACSDVFVKWLTGDFVGIITLAPLLLLAVVPRLKNYLQRGFWLSQRRSAASAKSSDLPTILIVLSALLLVFCIPWQLDVNQNFPLITLLLLLPLAFVALRYSLRGAVIAVVLLDGGMVILIALFDKQGQALHYQLVMIAIALMGLWLGGAVEARNRLMARYRDFASVSNDLLWEADSQGRLLEASGRLANQFVLTPGHCWRSLLHQGAQPQLAELDQALRRRQPFRQVAIAMQNSGGELLWIQLNGLPVRSAAGEFCGYRGSAVDVSTARQAEEQLRNYNDDLLSEVAERTRSLRQTNGELVVKDRHLEVLLAAVPVGVLEFDDAHRCRFINVNGCVLTGFTPEQAQGAFVLDFVHPDDRAHVEFVLKINRQSDGVQWLEFRPGLTDQRCSAHWINLRHADHSMDGAIMVLSSATARSQQDERLWTQAHHDALTDLPNRNLFQDRIGQALRHAKRRQGGAAVLWIDLDAFKNVNDSLGHAAGDALLQQVAQRLKSRIRDSDTVARMGGDEFAVIMPDITQPEDALQIARQMVASLAEPFDLPQGLANVSASIGVALYPQHATSVETLTQCADMAMYSAKNSGKNQVQVWRGAAPASAADTVQAPSNITTPGCAIE
ncbi:MAG: diguanylate cyclase/phosphodiesterase with sensor(s) [Proteobacteria bacterium]|nr:diguanylate cyclase/phosphodiesterase with sensor(s) [Pseudomonadota bacterium]